MRKTVLHRLLVALLFFASYKGIPQTNKPLPKVDKKAIDNYIKGEMKKQQIPGLTYAILQHGKIIDRGAYGLSNVELQSPVTIHTKFNLGSIGKTFTATGVMLLVQEGKISLDNPITWYLDSLPDTWKPITIRHLLSNTSGIRDYIDDFPVYPIIEKRDRKKDYTEAEFIQMAAEHPLNFPPGERYAYSSSNFVLLGFIIHKISGKSLPEFMKDRVFDPLGMNETVYMTQTAIIPNRAHGYLLNDNDKLINGNYISDFFSSLGDMGVTTTAEDMAKWSVALDSGKILDRGTLAKMWTPAILNNGEASDFLGSAYGLGWEIMPYKGYNTIGHGGSFKNGYTANYLRYADFNLTVIVLTNLNPTNLTRVTRNLAGFFVPALSGMENIKLAASDTALVDKVKMVITQITSDNLDTTLVTPGFKNRMNPVVKLLPKNPAVNYISSEMVSQRKLFLYGYPIEKINYCKLIFPGDRDGTYFTLYMTADNKIAGWSMYW